MLTPLNRAIEIYSVYDNMLSDEIEYDTIIEMCQNVARECVSASTDQDNIDYWLDVYNCFKILEIL